MKRNIIVLLVVVCLFTTFMNSHIIGFAISDPKVTLKKALEEGVYFLYQKQTPTGEFLTKQWEIHNTSTTSYVKSPFVTTFILHSLKSVENFSYVGEISQKATKYLLGEMEYDGYWRFYGKKSDIHFDMDTTSCALASLKEWKIEMDYDTMASKLLKYRNKLGLFDTWVTDIDPPYRKWVNNIDWVVNSNVLFFYSLLNQSLPEVEQYLLSTIETDALKKASSYYNSPLGLIYCLTRVYADGHNLRLEPAISKIRSYLLNTIKEGKLNDDPIGTALAIVGLLNCGISTGDFDALTSQIKKLLSMQGKDGGWPVGPFFSEGPYTLSLTLRSYIHRYIDIKYVVFGSEEFTTAIALEAISKYMEKI